MMMMPCANKILRLYECYFNRIINHHSADLHDWEGFRFKANHEKKKTEFTTRFRNPFPLTLAHGNIELTQIPPKTNIIVPGVRTSRLQNIRTNDSK